MREAKFLHPRECLCCHEEWTACNCSCWDFICFAIMLEKKLTHWFWLGLPQPLCGLYKLVQSHGNLFLFWDAVGQLSHHCLNAQFRPKITISNWSHVQKQHWTWGSNLGKFYNQVSQNWQTFAQCSCADQATFTH